MHSGFIASIVLFLFSHVAIADPRALAFVQKHKGLFASEIVDGRLFSQTFTTRAEVEPYRLKVAYDDSSKALIVAIDLIPNFQLQEVFESCLKRGTATGTTAMGVTVPFTKQTCHRIFLKGNDDKWLGDRQGNSPTRYGGSTLITLTGTPNQYRDLASRGFEIAVTFTPIKSEGIVVEYEQSFQPAKIDEPRETIMHVYKFLAKIHRVEYYFVGGKIPFRVDRFD